MNRREEYIETRVRKIRDWSTRISNLKEHSAKVHECLDENNLLKLNTLLSRIMALSEIMAEMRFVSEEAFERLSSSTDPSFIEIEKAVLQTIEELEQIQHI